MHFDGMIIMWVLLSTSCIYQEILFKGQKGDTGGQNSENAAIQAQVWVFCVLIFLWCGGRIGIVNLKDRSLVLDVILKISAPC